MKLSCGEDFHLQQQLDSLKGELAHALLQFSEIMQKCRLIEVLKSSEFHEENDEILEDGTFPSVYKIQVDYIRNFLLMGKIFPADIRVKVGLKILHDCEHLLQGVFCEMVKAKKCGDIERNEADQQQVVSYLILPTLQLIHECLEQNLATLGNSTEEQLGTIIKSSMNIFSESSRFLISQTGIALGKSDFLRIMALSQKVWKLAKHVKHLTTSSDNKVGGDELINSEMETVGEILQERILVMLSSENGRSFVKFWVEIFNTGKESQVCTSLQQISLSSTHFPEIYLVFTSYLEDAWFWRTETGKALTPTLIHGIMQDLSCDKAETRKRAAFVLRLLITQYSQNKQIFDNNIPEVSLISLGNMELGNYAKFWDAYFDLHDILNETQLHIVQPVLQKLQIFKHHSTNDSVLVWLPVLLKKMISHDNRTVVKEGFVQFLMTGPYLENQENTRYLKLAKDFLEKFIMPLIRDHIGWILNEPGEFFKNISTFGKFMSRLYSDQKLPQFKAAEVILEFLTSSGKCMGPHTIYFLVASLDEMLCDGNVDTTGTDIDMEFISSLEFLMNQLTLLLSNNLTTVSKFFRELLEHRCVSILLEILPYIMKVQSIKLESFLFMKLLAFLGSLSVKVFYATKSQEKLKKIIGAINEKEQDIIDTLIVGSKLYNFMKSNLGSSSALGLLRFVIISSQTSDKDILDNILCAVESFAWQNCNEEILQGSTQGLDEFYKQHRHEKLADIHAKILDELCKKLEEIDEDGCSLNVFKFCVQRLEVLSTLPGDILKFGSLPKLNFSSSCRLKVFLLQKLYLMKHSYDIDMPADKVKDFCSEPFRNLDVTSEISESYFLITERNIFAEYHQVQFCMYDRIIDTMSKNSATDKEVLSILLSQVVDEIEKCDWKGVVAGLFLAKSVTKLVDYKDEWNGKYLLDEIASVGWSLVFELRKSEAFWSAIKAFVELICCSYFLYNGYLNKYADLIFEHGESVSGLPLVLVNEMRNATYPEELLGDVHKILVKAALTGGPLPKNNRVSFAIWDYLRTRFNDEDNDPENFSSDCKARLLACEKLRSDIELLISSKEERLKGKGLTLLRNTVSTVLNRNDLESTARKRYFQGSSTHRIKQRMLQLLLTLQPFFNLEISQLVLDKVLLSLSTDSPQPSVRYMGEWIIILIIQKHPELNKIIFDCLDDCIQTRLGYGAFFSTICLHVSKLLKCQTFYDRALQSLATLTLSQHLTVRIYAQISFQNIYSRAMELEFRDVTDKHESVLSALSRASAYVSGNCSKLLENVSQDFYVNVFDSITHYHPEVIFTLLPRLSGVIKDECILQPKTIRKMVQVSRGAVTRDCEEASGYLEKLYMDHASSAWHLKTVVADGRELGEELPNETISPTQQPSQQASNNEMNYQKKINPWKLLSASEEIAEYANTFTKKRCIGEEGLVVVASLLDHLPNLGGLCRTCEIFGVHKYVVNSLKVVNDQHFQSLSVSAQNWVNILEVPVRDLESFLLTYSAKGYTILGVEQANESTSLTKFIFPKKSVLLLGNEKMGIPPELLHLVDKCIEIPQVGIIRSLNVHVTGALCIHQYASQNIL